MLKKSLRGKPNQQVGRYARKTLRHERQSERK